MLTLKLLFLTSTAIPALHSSAPPKALRVDEDVPAKLDALFEHCAEHGMLNAAVLLKRGGKTVYERAFGIADPRSGRELEIESAFYLASVSKQFTSMAAMVLSESGELGLDDRLTDYFPEFEPFAANVRIHQLMTHTSGIPDHYQLLGRLPETLTNEDVRALLVEHGALDFKPGTDFRYSNGGYVMLSMCAAKAGRGSFGEVLQKHVLEPLGMQHTLVYVEREPEVRARAHGFRPGGSLDDYALHTTGAGGMYSTVGDLAIWDAALHDGALVSPELLELAYTPPLLPGSRPSNYGFGWVMNEDENGRLALHSGGLAAFSTYIVRNLDNRDTLILLSNQGSTLVDIEELTDCIEATLGGDQPRLPLVRISIVLRRIIAEEGIDAALAHYQDVWDARPEAPVDLSESQLDSLGHEYLGGGQLKTALALFGRNVMSYPESANTWDSLGEAQLAAGMHAKARASYERSLELNPGNRGATAALEKIEAAGH